MSQLNDTTKNSLNIYLQSENADYSINESSKLFYLSDTIQCNPNERILVGITSFQCPYSFYNINTDINDEITFETSIGSYTLKLEPKNYDSSYLAEQMSLELAGQESILGGIIVLEFDTYTNKFTFSSTIEFSITNTNLYDELGLKDQIPTPYGYTYECNNVCNLGGISNIYVRLTNLSFKNLDSRGNISNVISTINVSAEPTYYIFYRPPEFLYFLINEQHINYLHIELTDDQGNDIVFNGCSWTLTLTIHFQYQRIERELDNNFIMDHKINNNKQMELNNYINSLEEKVIKLKKKNNKKKKTI